MSNGAEIISVKRASSINEHWRNSQWAMYDFERQECYEVPLLTLSISEEVVAWIDALNEYEKCRWVSHKKVICEPISWRKYYASILKLRQSMSTFIIWWFNIQKWVSHVYFKLNKWNAGICERDRHVQRHTRQWRLSSYEVASQFISRPLLKYMIVISLRIMLEGHHSLRRQPIDKFPSLLVSVNTAH